MDTLIIVFVYGFVAVLIFRVKNQNPILLNTVSVLIFIFLTQKIWVEYLNLTLNVFLFSWIVVGVLLITTYSIRLFSKPRLYVIDYFKLISIILITTLPIGSIDLSYLGNKIDLILQLISSIAPGILMTVFIYDRFILKTKNMKRSFLITLIVQTLFIFALLLYAFTERIEAALQRQIAVEQHNSCMEETERRNSEISELKLRIIALEDELSELHQQ